MTTPVVQVERGKRHQQGTLNAKSTQGVTTPVVQEAESCPAWLALKPAADWHCCLQRGTSSYVSDYQMLQACGSILVLQDPSDSEFNIK